MSLSHSAMCLWIAGSMSMSREQGNARRRILVLGASCFGCGKGKARVSQSENQTTCSADEIHGCLPEVSKNPIVSPKTGGETILL